MRANVDDKISGWAWSSNFGWISFNSTDCDAGCTGPPCESDGSPPDCPPAGTPYADYGVTIEPDGATLSGWAWSSNLGWIFFGPDADLGAPYGLVSSSTATAEPKQWAKYDSTDERIKGWAKILSLGDNGWIRFDHGENDPVTVNPATNELHGYAWNGNADGSGAGWISFNCEEGGASGENICAASDYRVIGEFNKLPVLTNLSAPNMTNTQLCEFGVRRASLRWTFTDEDGDTQDVYHIIVLEDSNPFLDTGECHDINDPSLDCIIGKTAFSFPVHDFSILNYGSTYTWSVKVWDSRGGESIWYDGPPFTIPPREYPESVFTWTPQNFSAGEEVSFISTTSARCYSSGNTETDCGSGSKWYWETAPDMSAISVNNSWDASSTILTFDNNAAYDINLGVTDPGGYTCTTTNTINVKLRLPTWIEVK